MRMTAGTPLVIAVALLLLSVGSIAAEVAYRHPNLTIVASDEPLDSVLKSMSQEMRIFVTTPSGLNPVVNCDIQNQPIERALKMLLGDMSYSLEWKDEQLVGLTILAGTEDSVAVRDSSVNAATPGVGGATASSGGEGTPRSSVPRQTATAPDHAPVDESASDSEREAREARMEEDRVEREAEMELRRQEELVEHKARMEEEALRNEAEMAEYFESQGIDPGQ